MLSPLPRGRATAASRPAVPDGAALLSALPSAVIAVAETVFEVPAAPSTGDNRVT